MSENPILFSGAMVRAILDGAKTQTRRLAKLDAALDLDENLVAPVQPGDTLWVRETWRVSWAFDHLPPSEILAHEKDPEIHYLADTHLASPHSGPRGKTRVSIHMPRWASRLSLRVTDVRVERLGDISAEDCIAEGAMHWLASEHPGRPYRHITPRAAFGLLWLHVHGDGAWERDRERWVWVYGFKVVR
ncbi:MAG: hypothetical protein MUF00_01530 [Gemmatimonadaceae bacterium]|jgi:hypothetical protein|nr:hypothetical protein [Gemmatimonadaceae bacterium]